MDNTEQKPLTLQEQAKQWLKDRGFIPENSNDAMELELQSRALAEFASQQTEALQANLAKYASENELWEKEVERLKAAQKSMKCPNCGDTIIYGVDSDKEKMKAEIEQLRKENQSYISQLGVEVRKPEQQTRRSENE